jgi:hypothetical protein
MLHEGPVHYATKTKSPLRHRTHLGSYLSIGDWYAPSCIHPTHLSVMCGLAGDEPREAGLVVWDGRLRVLMGASGA